MLRRGDPGASPTTDEVRSAAKAAFEPTSNTRAPPPTLALRRYLKDEHVKDGHVKDVAESVAEDVKQGLDGGRGGGRNAGRGGGLDGHRGRTEG